MYSTLSTAIILPAFMIALIVGTASAGDIRGPNAFEKAYSAMVLDGFTQDLCQKISHQSRSLFRFNSKGTQVYYERSRCYMNAAGKQLNPYLCRYVKEADIFLADGSYYSRGSCEEIVARGKPYNFTLSFDHQLVLEKMGYSEKELAGMFPSVSGEDPWLGYYLAFIAARDGSVQHRLNRLPDFSSGEK